VHPAVQVGLGDLFIEGAWYESGRFLVETHSEHLILRLLRRIREASEGDVEEGGPTIQPDSLSVLYVDPSPEGVRVKRLRVDENGEFVDRWPKGFFAERAEELF
jgi:predicted ATPase